MSTFENLDRRFKKSPMLLYLVLFFFLMVGTYFLFSRSSLSDTNSESARYLLSALVQSEAAVIALVVSLSLVAVQLTSSYPPKVTEIFRKNPHLRVLMFSYIVSIIYGIIILKIIGEFPTERIQQIYVNIACSLGIFCFLALIPFTFGVLNMLRPSVIVEKLAQDMTKNNLLTEENPFSSIFQIIERSVDKNDYETVKNALKTFGNQICCILKNNSFQESEEKEISGKILGGFMEIELLTTKEETYAIQTIEMIAEIISIAIERELRIVADKVTFLFERITTNIADRKFLWAVEGEISELRAIAEAAIGKGFPNIEKKAINYLREIAIKMLERYDRAGREGDKKREMNAAKYAKSILKELATFTDNEEISSLAERYSNEIESMIIDREKK